MVKLRVVTDDGADPPLLKFPKMVFNAVARLTNSAKGGGFVRDLTREVCKDLVETDVADRVIRNYCGKIIMRFCQKGMMERELRLDRSTRKFRTGTNNGIEYEREQRSYFYRLPKKAKNGPQMGKKAGPPKAPTLGPRKEKRDRRDQADPALRQRDPGPSTSGLRRSMGASSGSGSRQGRSELVPLIPWLSSRAVRIARRRGLAPGGSGAVVNQRSVAPDTASDDESEAELSLSGPVAPLDRSKQDRGYGKEPAGSPVLIRSGRVGTAATAASQSTSGDTSQTDPDQNGTQQEGEQLLDEEETAETASALQPLSPFGNMLASLQRVHASSTALEVEIASIAAENTEAKTAVECAQGEKEKILEVIRDITESPDTLPQFTGVQLSLAAYEKTICDFRDTHAEARRLESELASLRKRETAKKAALESELKKLGKEIESLESRLQKEKDAAEKSKHELDDFSMDPKMFGTSLHNFQNQWEIQKKTQGYIQKKENELGAAKTQAQATENSLATGISTAEEELYAAVSHYRELTAQLLTGRAGSQQAVGDPGVSTGAPTPGQTFGDGVPSQPEKLANDLFLQHQMETKAARAAETSGQKLQVKRKALAAEDEKFAKTLERVKQFLGDLPLVPSLGTLSAKERGDILRRSISHEKAMTTFFLELHRLRNLLDEEKKANEGELQKAKGRADVLRMKVKQVGNEMNKLIADLCGTNDVDHLNLQATALIKAKSDLAAAEADLKGTVRRSEIDIESTEGKISDMKCRCDAEDVRLRKIVARLYAGVKSSGAGNPGPRYVRPVEPARGHYGTHGDGTSTDGPDAGGYLVGTPTPVNLEEDAGNVGTDAGMDPAATPNGNTQEGAGEVGSDSEMEQEETPTRDEPVEPGSVGPRSEGSNTTSPRGGRDNLEQEEDLELAAFILRGGAAYYPPNCPYLDEYAEDFYEPPPQDFMEEDGGPGPSGSGLGDWSPSTGMARLDADAGSSTEGFPATASASLGPQEDPEEMDSD